VRRSAATFMQSALANVRTCGDCDAGDGNCAPPAWESLAIATLASASTLTLAIAIAIA